MRAIELSFKFALMTSSVLAATAIRPPVARAAEFRLTGGAVEEGDDRYRPAAGIEFVAGSGLRGEILVWGRNFGLVTERSVLVAGMKSLDLFGNKALSGVFGISFLGESTEVAADGNNDVEFDGDSSQSTNIGGVFGVRSTFLEWKNMTVGAAWESHVFPAGVAAVLLVTGRKQTLTVNAGVTL